MLSHSNNERETETKNSKLTNLFVIDMINNIHHIYSTVTEQSRQKDTLIYPYHTYLIKMLYFPLFFFHNISINFFYMYTFRNDGNLLFSVDGACFILLKAEFRVRLIVITRLF